MEPSEILRGIKNKVSNSFGTGTVKEPHKARRPFARAEEHPQLELHSRPDPTNPAGESRYFTRIGKPHEVVDDRAFSDVLTTLNSIHMENRSWIRSLSESDLTDTQPINTRLDVEKEKLDTLWQNWTEGDMSTSRLTFEPLEQTEAGRRIEISKTNIYDYLIKTVYTNPALGTETSQEIWFKRHWNEDKNPLGHMTLLVVGKKNGRENTRTSAILHPSSDSTYYHVGPTTK